MTSDKKILVFMLLSPLVVTSGGLGLMTELVLPGPKVGTIVLAKKMDAWYPYVGRGDQRLKVFLVF